MRPPLALIGFLALAVLAAFGQEASERLSGPAVASTAPLYRIDFREGQPVRDIGSTLAFRTPIECASDGTVLLDVVQSLNSGVRPSNISPQSPSLLLIGISLSGEVHSFPLGQVKNLYDLTYIADYVGDSEVVLLVLAAAEDKEGKKKYTTKDGTEHEFSADLAEHHYYILIFDRHGAYQKKIRADVPMRLRQIGLLPSGRFVVDGYDENDRTPKLAMLKDDGTLLKFLEVPAGERPASAMHTKDATGKGPAVYLAPVQFLGQGNVIFTVQQDSKFPILEVNEAGAIRTLRPKLPNGMETSFLVPSDKNLYALVSAPGAEMIYEFNSQDGSVLRRLHVGDSESAQEVACVHDGKFLSFKTNDNNLVPLVGIAQPDTNDAPANQP